MVRHLEERIADSEQHAFKSAGERRIAEFLEASGIRYAYEQPLLVLDQGKPRIWYPDFALLQLAIYIEYYGITGDPDYDRCTRHKREVYKAMELDVIPVYPATFRTDWQGYILDHAERIHTRRHGATSETRRQHHGTRSQYTRETRRAHPRTYAR